MSMSKIGLGAISLWDMEPGEQWWREFCYRLRLSGYDGWLSIEHEDAVLSRMEGMRRSIDLLKRTSIDEPSDYVLPAA